MKWKIQRKSDKMLCVEHYETSERYDRQKVYNTKYHERTKPREPDKVAFQINSMWGLCYGGR